MVLLGNDSTHGEKWNRRPALSVKECQSSNQAPHRCPDEAGPRIWCGCCRCNTEPHGSRLSSHNNGETESDLGRVVQRLAPRWFIVQDAHAANVGPVLLNARDTMSLMRGPMTRNEILQARQWRAAIEGVELPRISVTPPAREVEMPESVTRACGFRFADTEFDG